MNAKVRPSTGGLWTPANIVTLVRVVLMPVWLLFAELSHVADDSFSITAFLVFLLYAVISFTDKLDGYLARSRNEVTTFGKFLDPIADKLAVVVALTYLLEKGMVSSWFLLIIISREFLVSGLRMVVASAGVVVPASNLGKWKTAVTMLAINGYLLGLSLPRSMFFGSWFEILCNVSMWAAILLTAWSGIDYFIHCWPYVKGQK